MSMDYNNYGAGIADRIDLLADIDRIENDTDNDGFVPLNRNADDDNRGIIDFNLPTDNDDYIENSDEYGILNNDDYIDMMNDNIADNANDSEYHNEYDILTEDDTTDNADTNIPAKDDNLHEESDLGGWDMNDDSSDANLPDDDNDMPLSNIYNIGRQMIHDTESNSFVIESRDDLCSDITSQRIPESLDEIEQEIDRLKLRWSEVTYLIGQRLKYIADNRLYEQKGYRDFKTYVTLAIKMSENNAYYYISVFEYFTEEQTKRAGSKLKLIIPVLNRLKRDKTVSDELKAIKIKGMRDELYYKIYNKTYREAEKIITDMRQKYFTDIGKIVQFQRVRISKDKIIINEKDPEIQ
ncbi:MAG: hypothetical protein II707_03845, partial [Spirochaetales bacterium]|nr:hypothetical protein [Spirochaetales bacterium]